MKGEIVALTQVELELDGVVGIFCHIQLLQVLASEHQISDHGLRLLLTLFLGHLIQLLWSANVHHPPRQTIFDLTSGRRSSRCLADPYDVALDQFIVRVHSHLHLPEVTGINRGENLAKPFNNRFSSCAPTLLLQHLDVETVHHFVCCKRKEGQGSRCSHTVRIVGWQGSG